MKITQNVTYLNIATSAAKPGSAKTAGATEAPDARPSSPLIRQFLLPAVGGNNGGFNAARVAEIRSAISANLYQVNPEKIADGLIDSVRDLLGKKNS